MLVLLGNVLLLATVHGFYDRFLRERRKEAIRLATAAVMQADESAIESEELKKGQPLDVQKKLLWCRRWLY